MGTIRLRRRGMAEVGICRLIYPDRPVQYLQAEQELVIDGLPDFSLELKNLLSA